MNVDASEDARKVTALAWPRASGKRTVDRESLPDFEIWGIRTSGEPRRTYFTSGSYCHGLSEIASSLTKLSSVWTFYVPAFRVWWRLAGEGDKPLAWKAGTYHVEKNNLPIHPTDLDEDARARAKRVPRDMGDPTSELITGFTPDIVERHSHPEESLSRKRHPVL